jgi:hypothetical protein
MAPDPTIIREFYSGTEEGEDTKPIAARWSAETDQEDLLTITLTKPDGTPFKSVLIGVAGDDLKLWVHNDVTNEPLIQELTV